MMENAEDAANIMTWQRQVPFGGSTMDPTRLHLNLMEEACIVTQNLRWVIGCESTQSGPQTMGHTCTIARTG